MSDKKKIKNSHFPKNLSVVIPVYNEELRFEKGFEICRKFAEKYINWEFIFVNDGSTDKTEEIVKNSIKDFSQMKLVSYGKNQGKGFALKQGVEKTGKSFILITDIDFSTPIKELRKFYPLIKNNIDMVIGSRKVKGAQIVERQRMLREWLGARFTDLSNLWLGLNISDFTCGFKLFKADVAKKLFKFSKIKRWGYDAEIIYLAFKKGYKVKEVPVIWKNDERTKVFLIKDIFRSLLDLLLIKIY